MGTYIFFLILWIYLLSIFKRNGLGFYYFLFGSVGTFVFLLIGFLDKLIEPLSQLVAYLVGLFNKIIPGIQTFSQHKLIFLETDIPISLYIDFECSGILEIFAFISLVCFFASYNLLNKIAIVFSGTVYIIFANVLRILSIILIINTFGSEYYYIAHTIIGRLVFYILTITLYFKIFTKHQIVNQKVGNFNYD